MFIFDQLFGGGGDSTAIPDFPFELIAVTGKEAVATCLKLREESADVMPVMIGNFESVTALNENYLDRVGSPNEIIAESRKFQPFDFFESRAADDPDLYRDVDRGDWPSQSPPKVRLLAHCDEDEVPRERVFLAKVPAGALFELPAHIRFGGWNECPEPEVQVALHRAWYERYGAKIISLTNDAVDCVVENPPTTRDEAITLAEEHFMYSSDLVHEGAGTISNLAANLLNARYWHFWWD
jgi:hypothetical protein